ncbi:PQQ-binding-like beta-propeller repeat protein [Naasia aerilata]|uniref:Pyrrolo-quinoline quinone repeat domain-containing protein n=1 Tax=Naasia aerilata TaxID=1162966 RepID=A0ABM8GGM8_9MICO|nr:PQQ-binding-like beta-propeller repeat protein [Naasia aerilata]BDZ47518.1 hypothetical protein GCM10025866_34270 [Naasia aerilata]
MKGRAERSGPRRALLPAVLIPSLLVVLTGSLVAVDLPFAGEPGGAAARYVPADGAAERLRLQDGTVRTVEHARSVGAVGALTGPDAVNSAVIGTLGDGVTTAHLWRQLTTALDGQFTDLFALGDDGLRQLAGWGGGIGLTFRPGLLMLPADVAPGEKWSSTGSALGDDALTYSSTFAASAAGEDLTGPDGEAFMPPPGCLRIDGTLTIEQPGEGVLVTSTDTSVWCPGRGGIFSSGAQNGEPAGSVVVPARTPLPAPSAAPPAGDSGRGTPGRLESLEAVVVDPFFGESARQVSVTTAPVRTADGLVVAANEHGDDLLAWRPQGARAVLDWVAHPGGTIATVSTVGELILAATQERAVRAYDHLGRRVWSWTGDDLVLAPPAAVPESGDVLVATRGGTVARLRASDGREVWSVALGADARGPIAVAGGTVIVADERGRLTGLDEATGALRWRTDVGTSAGIAASPDAKAPVVSLVTTDGDLLALDARSGAELWDGAVTGILRTVAATESRVIVATDEQTVVFRAADGATVWTAGGAVSAVPASGDRVLTLSGRTVTLRDAEGAAVGEWPLPDSTDPADPRLLVSSDDVVIVGPALELWRVGLP